MSTLHRAGPVVRATLARAPDAAAGPRRRRARRLAPHGVAYPARARRPTSCAGSWAPPPTTSPTGTTGWPPASRCGPAPGATRSRGVLCVAYPLDGLRLASIDRRVAGPVDSALVREPARGELRRPPGRRRAGGVGVGHRGQPRPPLVRRDLSRRAAGRVSRAWTSRCSTHRVLDRLPAGTEVELTRAPIEDLARGVRRGRRGAVRAARAGAETAHRDRRRRRGGARQEHVLLAQARLGHLPSRSQRMTETLLKAASFTDIELTHRPEDRK